MRSLPLIFFGIFLTLASGWLGLVLSSQIQFGSLKPIALEEGDQPQPRSKVGVAQQGSDVYINQGCVYCHSQQVRRPGYGSDYERGWGERQTVPRDYIFEPRPLIGNSRTGPDLTNIGQRQPSQEWHYLHLFNPRITSPGSIMPSFPYLFDVQEIEEKPATNALKIPDAFKHLRAPQGFEIVPSAKAEQLVAYLQSMKLDYELPEARFYSPEEVEEIEKEEQQLAKH